MKMKRLMVQSGMLVVVMSVFLLCSGCGQNINALRKTAEQGDAGAQLKLGEDYLFGLGVPQNDAEAAKWFRKSAEQGLAWSQFMLGGCYERRQGVPKDDAEAVKWFRKAAEQGFFLAQFNLGKAYENGDGVPQDFIEAYKWFNLAAAKREIKDFIEARDELTTRMTAAQIAEGKKRAAEFVPKKSEPSG